LMQQLLTGKKRFKEFKNEKWKECQLHKVVETLFSNVDKKSHENELPVLLCNYMDVYKNQYITDEIPFMQATAKESEVHKFSLKLDDVVITKDSETPDDIANSAVVVKPLKNVLCGYHLAILRPLKNVVSGLFLANMLMLQVIRHQFSRVANGATRFGLGVGDIKKVPICIPSIDEQQKIASVLKTANREIELLSDKLEALKNQKKGLMQKLLTGKIRVNV
ncbi:restriction endonuclease subunit S, partial [Planctomycetota bacterium]